jgi:hypothetical protein
VEVVPACWLGYPALPAYNEFRTSHSTTPARGSTTSCRLRRNGMGSETAGPQEDAAHNAVTARIEALVDTPQHALECFGSGPIDLLGAGTVRPASAHAIA